VHFDFTRFQASHVIRRVPVRAQPLRTRNPAFPKPRLVARSDGVPAGLSDSLDLLGQFENLAQNVASNDYRLRITEARAFNLRQL
jgi:hypothetical protein